MQVSNFFVIIFVGSTAFSATFGDHRDLGCTFTISSKGRRLMQPGIMALGIVLRTPIPHLHHCPAQGAEGELKHDGQNTKAPQHSKVSRLKLNIIYPNKKENTQTTKAPQHSHLRSLKPMSLQNSEQAIHNINTICSCDLFSKLSLPKSSTYFPCDSQNGTTFWGRSSTWKVLHLRCRLDFGSSLYVLHGPAGWNAPNDHPNHPKPR